MAARGVGHLLTPAAFYYHPNLFMASVLVQADIRRVLDALRTAFGGNVAGEVYQGNRVFDVSVILDPASRRQVTDIGSLPLHKAAGTYVEFAGTAEAQAQSRRKIEGPMALVIPGGMATSAALNLLVFPTLARQRGRFEAASET